jgi:hypothetical protein
MKRMTNEKERECVCVFVKKRERMIMKELQRRRQDREMKYRNFGETERDRIGTEKLRVSR